MLLHPSLVRDTQPALLLKKLAFASLDILKALLLLFIKEWFAEGGAGFWRIHLGPHNPLWPIKLLPAVYVIYSWPSHWMSVISAKEVVRKHCTRLPLKIKPGVNGAFVLNVGELLTTEVSISPPHSGNVNCSVTTKISSVESI